MDERLFWIHWFLDMDNDNFDFTDEQRRKLAQLVHDLRNGMSYDDFSIVSGLSPASIQNLEQPLFPHKKGKRIKNFSISTLSKIAFLWDKKPPEYLIAWIFERDLSPEGLKKMSTEHLLKTVDIINDEIRSRLIRSEDKMMSSILIETPEKQ